MALWLVPAGMLLIAFLDWPYGYYQFLRLVVFLTGGFLTWQIVVWKQSRMWAVLFGIMAFVMNPLFPIHLTREIWSILNLVFAAVFLAHLYVNRRTPPKATDAQIASD